MSVFWTYLVAFSGVLLESYGWVPSKAPWEECIVSDEVGEADAYYWHRGGADGQILVVPSVFDVVRGMPVARVYQCFGDPR